MDRTQVLKDIKTKFKEDIINVFEKTPKRVYIDIEPKSIRDITQYIVKHLGARFNSASGVDVRHHMEILYHFIFEEINVLISLRVTSHIWRSTHLHLFLKARTG